jgi:hypothetical protein
VRYNTLYRNGAFDFIQNEHVGPNKVAGVAAKHVGFLHIYNNIIVCRGDEQYSAFSVWDSSPTDVQHNMLVNCSVQLVSGDANRTSTTDNVLRDPTESFVTRQDLETRFELTSLGIDLASSAYVVFEREARESHFHHSLTHITHEFERKARESQLYHSLMEYHSK